MSIVHYKVNLGIDLDTEKFTLIVEFYILIIELQQTTGLRTNKPIRIDHSTGLTNVFFISERPFSNERKSLSFFTLQIKEFELFLKVK